MNHLAHSLLSCGDPDLLMGNMLTDFVNLKEARQIHEDFQKGIEIHRLIDKFMDTHPLTKEAIQMIKPSQGKYASVSIDLLFDYLLANNWKKYNGESIEDFSNDIYRTLEQNFDKIPDFVSEKFQRLISYKFLEQYQELWRFEKVMKNMQKRAKFKANFENMMKDIESDLPRLDVIFNTFFPLAISYIDEQCNC